jgi:hypothetical protein
MEGQVSARNGSSCNEEMSFLAPEPSMPEIWDSDPLLSLPGDPCKSITFEDSSAYLF